MDVVYKTAERQSSKGSKGEVLTLSKTVCVAFVFCVTTTIYSHAQSFQTLDSFSGANGSNPAYMSLVQGTNGNFYGTTSSGGAHQSGSVFSVSSGGTVKTLYSFCARTNCADGAQPFSGLIRGADGNFYGTTESGGANLLQCTSPNGCGTVFKISPAGKLTTLYSFCPQLNCPDGSEPLGPLVQGEDGNFYGTTSSGGAYLYGAVFKLTPQGKLITIYSFCEGGFPCTDGSRPSAGLVQAGQYFYGTTLSGGASNYGTVFKITSGGTLNTLYSFCSQSFCTDGAFPLTGLIQAANGKFYGTTSSGGLNNGGTAFQITPSGVLTTLYIFCSQNYPDCTDGSQPYGQLVQATNGNFYGTTYQGGANQSSDCPQGHMGCGTIFEITSTDTLKTLYSFCSATNCSDGDSTQSGLLQSTVGSFYGTTSSGGTDFLHCTEGCGTIFRLSVGLGPFVETIPTSGKAGAKVTILGNNLSGTTQVSFNGAAASFTVVSSTEISTTVPTGATTGKAKVTTPTKILLSNVAFHVLP